jgi:hypothetical protein
VATRLIVVNASLRIFQSLAAQIGRHHGQTGEISAGPTQAANESGAYGIAAESHDDGSRIGELFDGAYRWSAGRNDGL